MDLRSQWKKIFGHVWRNCNRISWTLPSVRKIIFIWLEIELISKQISRKVSDALKNQTDLLWHAPAIYMHPKIQEYAKKLTDKMPGDLKVVFFIFFTLYLTHPSDRLFILRILDRKLMIWQCLYLVCIRKTLKLSP